MRLAHEADVAVVAPATANVLAKLAHGLADDLLSGDAARGDVPAGPRARDALRDVGASGDPSATCELLRSRGATIVGPATGPLAHGDEGVGRLAEPEDVVAAVRSVLATARPRGSSTADHVGADARADRPGPIRREPLHRQDGRRARGGGRRAGRGGHPRPRPWHGRARRGAEVVRVADRRGDARRGPRSRRRGRRVVMAAAVADFRPKAVADRKLKKDAGIPELVLEPTPDILAELGERHGAAVLVGFAAETQRPRGSGPGEARSEARSTCRGREPRGSRGHRVRCRTRTRR